MAATVASYLSWHYSPRNTPSLRLFLSDQVVDCGPLRARSLKLARITIEGISNDTTNRAESAPHVRVCPPSSSSSSSSVRICALKSAGMGWIGLCDKPLFSKRSRLPRRPTGAEERGPLVYCMPGVRTDRPRLLALLSGRQPCGMTIEVVNSPIHNVKCEYF